MASVMKNVAHEIPFPPPLISLKPRPTPSSFIRPGLRPSRHALPSAWYRAGTSKGLFIQRQHLPAETSAWAPILLSAMGSKDGDAKQLDGIGGGSPTTSKVAIVERSRREGIDLEYTFVQVVPDSGRIDMTGNCGNIASGVAPYALDEGLIIPVAGKDKCTVRILNTNTDKVIEAVVQLDSETYLGDDSRMPFNIGLPSEGSPIKVSFMRPGGSMTGKMFPTGQAQQWLQVRSEQGNFSVLATLIDAANPFIFVDSDTLPESFHQRGLDVPESKRLVEDIRRAGAVQMGLAQSIEQASLTRGTPKIAILSTSEDVSSSIQVTSFSTGRVHPSLQLTGAVCLASAVVTPGTVAWDLSARRNHPLLTTADSQVTRKTVGDKTPSSKIQQQVVIGHRSGQIEVEVMTNLSARGNQSIDSVNILRTARRLFEGNVFYDL